MPRVAVAILALCAGCSSRAPAPIDAGPAVPEKGRGKSRVAQGDADGAPRPALRLPLPDSFEALRAESLALAVETRRRHGDAPATIDLQASMLARFGDLAAAAALWEEWLVAHPDTPEARLWLGKLARERGDEAGATEHFRAAFAGRPEMPGAQVLLGAALVNAGLAEEACAVLERQIPAVAGNPNRSILLGHARMQAGDPAGARAAFERAVELSPGSVHAIYGLANACARLGDQETARRLRAEVTAIKAKTLEHDRAAGLEKVDDMPFLLPVVARWYAAAGRIEAIHGDPAAAERRWLRAVEFDPAQREAVGELERSWRRQGRAAEADRLVAAAQDALRSRAARSDAMAEE
jgi:tetratricopeptide (TPR) repeat protein